MCRFKVLAGRPLGSSICSFALNTLILFILCVVDMRLGSESAEFGDRSLAGVINIKRSVVPYWFIGGFKALHK